jgi:glutamate 5-kinase
MTDFNIKSRKKVIEQSKRVVIKVGTRLLTDPERIPVLIAQIARLRAHGFKILLVSSGAVGLGMNTLKVTKRPSRLSEIQALAAVGQNKLMSRYESECAKYGFHTAQLLLTAEDLRDRERHLNVLNCVNALWNSEVLPIINENDSVSVDELKFGDNDFLAGLLAIMIRAELTIILTTVSGLHKMSDGKLGERISTVKGLDDELRGFADGTDGNEFSTGGMVSKLRAVDTVTAVGGWLWIADGQEDDIIDRIIKGEDVGTLFLPESSTQMQSRKRWIKFFSRRTGKLLLDAGAVEAIKFKGRSLLPSGVIAVQGQFKRGDTIELCDSGGAVVARGLINYNSTDCEKVMGLKTSELVSVLKRVADDELVHRNNMVILKSRS